MKYLIAIVLLNMPFVIYYLKSRKDLKNEPTRTRKKV